MTKSYIFTEIGIDFDNNRYGIGISTEIEDQHGKEIRVPGFLKMKINGVYGRVWLFKRVFGIGIPGGFVIKKKNRYNFKLVLGLTADKTGMSSHIKRVAEYYD